MSASQWRGFVVFVGCLAGTSASVVLLPWACQSEESKPGDSLWALLPLSFIIAVYGVPAWLGLLSNRATSVRQSTVSGVGFLKGLYYGLAIIMVVCGTGATVAGDTGGPIAVGSCGCGRVVGT